ncbi:hypothetical protein M5689_018737 [Euphorbia peplus]|nr:hypothetical protein M5689_018737 [Euphorbia peplus]
MLGTGWQEYNFIPRRLNALTQVLFTNFIYLSLYARMEDHYICLRVIHSGKFMTGTRTAYVGGKTLVLDPHLDMDMLSFPNIRSYLNDVGYGRVKAVYYLSKKHDEFILIDDDNGVMAAMKDLKDMVNFDVYIDHYNPLLLDTDHNEQVEVGQEAARNAKKNNRADVETCGEAVDGSSDTTMLDGGRDHNDLEEEANEPHTNVDDLLFHVSFLTDDEDEELQEARQKIIDYKKKYSITVEKVGSEIISNVTANH